MARVPSYRYHKASGQAVVVIAGRSFYLGKFNSKESRKAYARIMAEWKSAGKASFGTESDQVTVAMLWADYRDHCDEYYPESRKSEAVMIRIAWRFMDDYLDVAVKDFNANSLRAVRAKMLEAVGARGKPLSRKYINKQISRVIRGFSWGVGRMMVDASVCGALKAVEKLDMGRTKAPELKKITGVPDAKVEATLPQCSTVVADMIRVQQMTGMRPGEVCMLTPGMIDRSGPIWTATLAHHKTAHRGKERVIYLGPQAQAVILKYLVRAEDAPLFSPAEAEAERRAKQAAERVTPPKNRSKPVPKSSKHKSRKPGIGYTTESYGRAIDYACDKVWPVPEGAKKEEASAWKAKYWWAPNQLRHSAATKIRKQYGVEAAQVILGHSSIVMTQHYAEKDEALGTKVAAMVG